jgi:hypothetical protein
MRDLRTKYAQATGHAVSGATPIPAAPVPAAATPAAATATKTPQ